MSEVRRKSSVSARPPTTREASPASPPPPVEGTVKFLLSEAGRRHSLLQGGDGCRVQVLSGPIDSDRLNSFHVDEQGQVIRDLTDPVDLYGVSGDGLPGTSLESDVASDLYVVWNVVPTWHALLEAVTEWNRWEVTAKEKEEEKERKVAQIAAEFGADKDARATTIGPDFAVVGGHKFRNGGWDGVFIFATQRRDQDVERLKAANRASLAEWIQQHGTENQKERLAADLLPWQEAHKAVDDDYFLQLERFPLYERFDVLRWGEICVCGQFSPGSVCEPTFQSVDATELTADEWERLAAIKATATGAEFQLREHRAKCDCRSDAIVRRGVIVKFKLGQLTFKREFALTNVEVRL